MKPKKILISGGHLTPALAFIDFVQTHESKIELAFVGRKYSQDELKQEAHESEEVNLRGIAFFFLQVPRFPGRQVASILWWPFRFARACIAAFILIVRQKPSVFVSFGGYLAVPLALACFVLRVPIVTHEQTVAVGLANKIIGLLAKKIAVGFPDAIRYFPSQKSVITGNPIRPEILAKNPTKPNWLPPKLSKPILYITGGNQGSLVINVLVTQGIQKFTKDFFVIHACGSATSQENYLQSLSQLQQRLPAAHRNFYLVREWLSAEELGWILHQDALVISRAGANTVTELIATHTPALLIPLPFAHADEQTKNAKLMVDAGGAICLPQQHANQETVLASLKTLVQKQKVMRRNLTKIALPLDGAQQLFQVVTKIS